MLNFVVHESTNLSDEDREVTVQILLSIAERYLEECDYFQEKPIQAILRAAAKISVTFDLHSLNRICTLQALEKVSETTLTWADVAAFAAGDSIKLGLHIKVGQKVSCKIKCQVMNGYAVILYGNEDFPGILETKTKFETGAHVDAYFVRREKNRAFLTLQQPGSESSQQFNTAYESQWTTTEDSRTGAESLNATGNFKQYRDGMQLVCAILKPVPGGYRVHISENKPLAYLATSASLQINEQILVTITGVKNERFLLQECHKPKAPELRLLLHIMLAELGGLDQRK